MKKLIWLQVVGIVTFVLGNTWVYNVDISEWESSTYQIRLISWIPEWLPLVLFLIVLVLLIRMISRTNVKSILVLQVIGLITYIVGNYWFYLVNVEDYPAMHQVQLIEWMPQGLSLVVFLIVFGLMIRNTRRHN